MTPPRPDMRFVEPHRDPWRPSRGEDGPLERPDPQPHLLLEPAQWRAVRGQWPADLPVGVVLPNDADLDELAADLGAPSPLALIALQFPKWTDGRAYSQARQLRVRHGFAGQLRAVGEVLVDMLPLLQRCGFDAVQLRRDQSVDAAQRALEYFAGHYQADVHRPVPAFARSAQRQFTVADLRSPDLFAGQGI